jgi:hypothetical protein
MALGARMWVEETPTLPEKPELPNIGRCYWLLIVKKLKTLYFQQHEEVTHLLAETPPALPKSLQVS